MLAEAVTAAMVDDLIRDPVRAAEILLGYKLMPHEQLRLWGMWHNKYFMDCSGFGTGKTLCAAITLALRCMLLRDRTEGLFSRTFRQEQLVFRYFDDWASDDPRLCKPAFRNALELNHKLEPDIFHGADKWYARFKGNSQVRALPPGAERDFLNIQSEDWTGGVFDEFSKYYNWAMFKKNVQSRVRRPISECYKIDPVTQHHFAYIGTAGLMWQPQYQTVKMFQEAIAKGDPEYGYQSWNYKDIPRRFERYIPHDALKLMMGELRQDEVKTEIMGLWTNDSVGFYAASALNAPEFRSNAVPVLTQRIEAAA
jgi:hypothetical protein